MPDKYLDNHATILVHGSNSTGSAGRSKLRCWYREGRGVGGRRGEQETDPVQRPVVREMMQQQKEPAEVQNCTVGNLDGN